MTRCCQGSISPSSLSPASSASSFIVWDGELLAPCLLSRSADLGIFPFLYVSWCFRVGVAFLGFCQSDTRLGLRSGLIHVDKGICDCLIADTCPHRATYLSVEHRRGGVYEARPRRGILPNLSGVHMGGMILAQSTNCVVDASCAMSRAALRIWIGSVLATCDRGSCGMLPPP